MGQLVYSRASILQRLKFGSADSQCIRPSLSLFPSAALHQIHSRRYDPGGVVELLFSGLKEAEYSPPVPTKG